MGGSLPVTSRVPTSGGTPTRIGGPHQHPRTTRTPCAGSKDLLQPGAAGRRIPQPQAVRWAVPAAPGVGDRRGPRAGHGVDAPAEGAAARGWVGRGRAPAEAKTRNILNHQK